MKYGQKALVQTLQVEAQSEDEAACQPGTVVQV
jgi:hypothetical protein